MVRGRRVRALVASVKGNDSCDSPKRKDQRLDFSAKLSHVIVSPTQFVKNQTITDFFQVVQDEDPKVKNYVTQSFFEACQIAAREKILQTEICEEIIEIKEDGEFITVIVSGLVTVVTEIHLRIIFHTRYTFLSSKKKTEDFKRQKLQLYGID